MRWAVLSLLGVVVAVIVWAAASPVVADDRDQVFEIPKGTWARRMAGDKVEILPREVRLTLGINDVLVLKNNDDVPQVFGPALMMPGQSFRLPFEVAASYQFACTAHASGQMSVRVEPGPAAGWERLAWRTRSILGSRGRA
jgi:hypothetical protein